MRHAAARRHFVGAFEAIRPLLEQVAEPDHRGEDPGLALLWYQLEEDLPWTAMTGWLHAVALARTEGITAAELLPSATSTFEAMQELSGFYTPRIDEGDHGGELDTLASAAAGVDHVVETARNAGVDTALADGSLEGLRGAAHTLKSASASVGALLLARLCEELEHEAREGEIDDPEGQVDRIVDIFGLTQVELQRLRHDA